MRKFEVRTTKLVVAPKGEQVFSEMATWVEIKDDAAGEFVMVTQSGRTDVGQIAIDTDEWPALRDAIDRMIAQCRGNHV
jgi:hypothetical protein